MAFCNQCGAPLRTGNRFCTGCGRPLAQPDLAGPPAPAPNAYQQPEAPAAATGHVQRPHAPVAGGRILLVALAVLAIGAGAYFWLRPKDEAVAEIPVERQDTTSSIQNTPLVAATAEPATEAQVAYDATAAPGFYTVLPAQAYFYGGPDPGLQQSDYLSRGDIFQLMRIEGNFAYGSFGGNHQQGEGWLELSDLCDPGSGNEQLTYPGGNSGWRSYVAAQLNNDVVYRAGVPQGHYTVLLSFDVDAEGRTGQIRVLTPGPQELAVEAARVVRESGPWQGAAHVRYVFSFYNSDGH